MTTDPTQVQETVPAKFARIHGELGLVRTIRLAWEEYIREGRKNAEDPEVQEVLQQAKRDEARLEEEYHQICLVVLDYLKPLLSE